MYKVHVTKMTLEALKLSFLEATMGYEAGIECGGVGAEGRLEHCGLCGKPWEQHREAPL